MIASHQPLAPFAAWAGPRQPKLLVLGEAWGESEAQAHQPFVGSSGKELWRMLGEAIPAEPELHRTATRAQRYDNAWVGPRRQWLEAVGIGFTNVFNLRPMGNQLGWLCGPKPAKGEPGWDLPPLGRSNKDLFPNGAWVQPQYLGELARLQAELDFSRPNLVVAAGNTACWAVLQATNIGSIRGNTAEGVGPGQGLKVLPTYHPAGVMRQWSWRPIVVADLMKAWREAQFPELRRPERQVIINPTMEELEQWVRATMAQPPAVLAVDIETGNRQIKCIGFARSRSEALVVPFVDLRHPSGSYWPTASQELQAWNCVRALLESSIPKVFQNGLYDLQYILGMGLRPDTLTHDTMLLHHSLFPEMQKGLGFLGSIYTNEASWKLMNRPKTDSEKRDE